MTHWHAETPWAEAAVYVPATELAEALAGGTVRQTDGTVVPMDAKFHLAAWDRLGETDCYILDGPMGFSVGIRYGAEEHEYLSPHVRDQAVVQALYQRHTNRTRSPSPRAF